MLLRRSVRRLKARQELGRGVYQMWHGAKVDSISIDLETMCKVPELLGATSERLVVTF